MCHPESLVDTHTCPGPMGVRLVRDGKTGGKVSLISGRDQCRDLGPVGVTRPRAKIGDGGVWDSCGVTTASDVVSVRLRV